MDCDANDTTHCPKCNYPGIGPDGAGPYFGVYFTGGRCGKCGYVDLTAATDQEIERAKKSIITKIHKTINNMKKPKKGVFRRSDDQS